MSVKTYLRARENFPTDAQVPFDLGKLYLKLGKKAEAHAEFQHALTLTPAPDLKRSLQELLDKNPRKAIDLILQQPFGLYQSLLQLCQH